MRYEVRTIVMDKETRKFVTEAVDIIDTDSNILFSSVNNNNNNIGIHILEAIYEAYWNVSSSKDIIKVIGIEKL